MPEVLKQVQAFILTLVLGVASGLVINYYQLIVRNTRLKAVMLYLLDLLLWVFIILLVFAAMLWINQGEIRFYVLLALVFGIIIYFRKLAHYVDKQLLDMALKTLHVCAFIRNGFTAVLKKVNKLFAGLKKDNHPPPDQDAD